MTGLDPAVDVILQAALVITTAELEPLDEIAVDVGQPEEALAGMSPFVREMHTRTGLVERVRLSTIDVEQAERRLLACVSAWCPAPATLCGNSIWNDRRFHRALHAGARPPPALPDRRRLQRQGVGATVVAGEAAVFAKPTAGAYDATVDVRQSIAELRHYQQTLFRPFVRSSVR